MYNYYSFMMLLLSNSKQQQHLKGRKTFKIQNESFKITKSTNLLTLISIWIQDKK